MTGREIAYEPPRPILESTFSAIQAFVAPSMGARIDPDPLGTVNKIIRLTHNGKPVGRAVLYPVNAGSTVRVVHESGGYRLEDLYALRGRMRAGAADAAELELPERRAPGWYVEVDGRPVLHVTESEMLPPAAPRPPVPWRSRVRTATRRRARGWMDAAALRLGYRPADEFTGDDFW